MNGLDAEIKNVFSGKVGFAKISESDNQIFLKISPEEFDRAAAVLSEKEFTLISMFCEQQFETNGFSLFYVFEKSNYSKLLVLIVNLKSEKANSIQRIFPAAFWFEREISDGFGIIFENSSDSRRLFLHEIYPDNFHPLLKSFKDEKINFQNFKKKEMQNSPETREYKFREIKGEGIYQIPVGPIHAGIIEPGHFRFSVIGEMIFNLEIRMFYLHRGIEKLAEGKKPEDAVNIAESISGDESAANAAAFCNAAEKLSDESIPERAVYLRTLLLEMERIYSHLGDLGGMAVDVASPVGASGFFVLREEILRKNQSLTGSRFLKGIISVGGLTKDIEKKKLIELSLFLTNFKQKTRDAAKFIYESSSIEDRFENTGIIKHELISPLNITGPAARACGVSKDTRIDYPYEAYKKINIEVKTKTAGDVESRFRVRVKEIMESIKIIQDIISAVPAGEVKRKITLKDGFIISLVEAPRGQNLHYIHLKNGIIHRYKIRTSSFCNWQAIEHAVLGNIVPDFPLINKSLNLTYAGTDL